MKFCCVLDHQRKSARYAAALVDAGYIVTDRQHVRGLRFFLTDADWRERMMENAAANRTPVFLYPHAARPMVQYDGCVKPVPVTAMFTQAEGGRAIMQKIGYPYPVEVSGWAYSEIRPFHPVERVKRICFAPIHPNANGWLSNIDKSLNRETYFRLFDYCKESGVQLSVRYIGLWSHNGLDGVPWGDFVEIHQGKKDNSSKDMEAADVVVAHQTFAWIAVAFGIPTVMMGESIPPRSGNSDEGFCYVSHWNDYKSDLMYPLDILAEDPAEVIGKAACGGPAVEEWKQRLIGEPFNGPAFVEKLESYL